MAKDVSTLKAVSQNLMHENLSVTDGVYGILSETDVGEQIAMLDIKATKGGASNDELIEKLKQIIGDLETSSANG